MILAVTDPVANFKSILGTPSDFLNKVTTISNSNLSKWMGWMVASFGVSLVIRGLVGK